MSVGEFCMRVQLRVLCLLLIHECVNTIWSWGFISITVQQLSSHPCVTQLHSVSFNLSFHSPPCSLLFFFRFCFLILSVAHFFFLLFLSCNVFSSTFSVPVSVFLFHLSLFFHMNSLSFLILSFPFSLGLSHFFQWCLFWTISITKLLYTKAQLSIKSGPV